MENSGKNKRKLKPALGMLLLLLVWGIQSCVDTFEPNTQVFESALIIEATITNEERRHEILLSRTFRLEEEGPNPEIGANVRISDDVQNEFLFEETAPGNYTSTVVFNAQAGRTYTLAITTSDGRNYGSETTALTPTAQIENFYASREINDKNEEGMALLVDSSDPNGEARYYRYEYEETYKVIAPRWVAVDAVVVRDRPAPPIVILEPKMEEQRVCYATVKSNTIRIADTNNFGEAGIKGFPVRFIPNDNYIMSHRYSILLRQFVQSRAAYTYYETLNEFSAQAESLFSQTQPGFFSGNVFSTETSDEKVLGFFQVSSVAARRIYFNYEDFYPGEPLPPYESDCSELFLPTLLPRALNGPSALVQAVNSLKQKYVEANGDMDRPFFLVTRSCGDCTALGSNVVPDFWVE